MTWLVEVDARTCIGSGICAAPPPDHFAVIDEGHGPGGAG
jgi:ferredoxin